MLLYPSWEILNIGLYKWEEWSKQSSRRKLEYCIQYRAPYFKLASGGMQRVCFWSMVFRGALLPLKYRTLWDDLILCSMLSTF